MMFISQLSPFWEVLSMKLKIVLSNSKWSILLFNIFGLNQRCYWLVNMRSRLPRSGKFFPSKLKSRIQETNWLIWFIHQLSYLNFFLFSKYVPSKKKYIQYLQKCLIFIASIYLDANSNWLEFAKAWSPPYSHFTNFALVYGKLTIFLYLFLSNCLMVKFNDSLRTSSHKFEIPEMSADTLNSNAGIS